MSLISEIFDRAKDQLDTKFRIIGLAADLAALKDSVPRAVPALYIFAKEEASEPNSIINAVRQRTEIDIGFMLITQNVADAKAGATAVEIEELKDDLRAAFVGFQPASACEAIENIGGQIVKANGGTVWWEHTMGAAFYITD